MNEKGNNNEFDGQGSKIAQEHFGVINNSEAEAKKISKKKVLGSVVLGVMGAGAGMYLVGAVMFYNGVTDELKSPLETSTEVIEAGEATVVFVSTEIPPITVATALTEVQGVKVGFEVEMLTIPVTLSTITRGTPGVETSLTIDPDVVELEYDSLEKKLTITAPDVALSTSVDIATGSAKTEDTSGSIPMLSADILTAITNTIAGTFGADASEVPLLGQVADGTREIRSVLEQIADLEIVTSVDKQCTPLITRIPDFTNQLKENIKTAVQGKLLDAETTNDPNNKGLADSMSLPLSEVQEIVKNATVVIPDSYTVGPDQVKIDQLNSYHESGFFELTEDTESIVCGIDKNITLISSDDSKGNQ